MDALAEEDMDQHEQRRDIINDAPRPSTPLPGHHRRHTDHPNPPRRRGQLKTRSRRVSHTRKTYQVTQARQDRIGRIGHIVYDVYGPEMVVG
jgi:hypothetical protein